MISDVLCDMKGGLDDYLDNTDWKYARPRK